jgi:hypothetical protein
MLDNPEDAGTLAYLADTATQAGAATRLVAMDTIGLTPKGQFVDPNEAPIEIAFKLYPWEWMFREEFGGSLKGASTRWIEPPWKAILSGGRRIGPFRGNGRGRHCFVNRQRWIGPQEAASGTLNSTICCATASSRQPH